MSLALYTPATRSGIIDLIYKTTGADTTKYPLMDVVADINLAVDKFFAIAIQASGVWQLDDSNQTDYPIISANLISGQRDYSFTVDGSNNLILDIYRVMVANPSGRFYDLELVDQQTKGWQSMGMVDGQNVTGQPSKYDKTANAIFFDAIPNYNYSLGVKAFVNREALRFSVPTSGVADTTKPGFAGTLHEYFVIRPSYFYALRKGLKNVTNLGAELLKYEGDDRLGVSGSIGETYSKRSKDEKTQIIPTFRSSR